MCKGNKKKPEIEATMDKSGFDPNDGRPFVKDLLKEHAKKIEEVRQKIRSDQDAKPLFDRHFERYDDLWILRFVLTHKGKVKLASKAAIRTIAFREEQKLNELGDIRHLIRNYGVEVTDDSKAEDEFLPYYHDYNAACGPNCITITQPDPNRGIMVYMDLGNFDVTKLNGTLSPQQHKEYQIRGNEATFQVLDEVTRRTGRLTKLTNLMDLTNVSLMAQDGKTTRNDELVDFWPQLLGSIYVFNAPSWVNGFWKVVKLILPKRIVEKVDFMPKSAVSGKFYKPLLKYVTEENLPEKYGGKNTTWPLPSISEQLAAAKAIAGSGNDFDEGPVRH